MPLIIFLVLVLSAIFGGLHGIGIAILSMVVIYAVVMIGGWATMPILEFLDRLILKTKAGKDWEKKQLEQDLRNYEISMGWHKNEK